MEIDWDDLLPRTPGSTYLFGNPPFIGQKEKSLAQREDMKRVWGKGYNGYLDYVTGWHAQSMKFFSGRKGEFAYVTTNSITQGQPVPALFGPLFREGWRIKFAHRTFAWDSEAPGKAAVHCVIVGFSRDATTPRLWDYPNAKGSPVELQVERGINAYLVDGPNVLITKRSDKNKLSEQLPVVNSGSTAYDWGLYTFEPSNVDDALNDPIAKKYLRRYVGGEELINDLERWCLWLKDVSTQDISNSSLLRERISTVQEKRASSDRKGTRETAKTPHRFGEDRQPLTPYLAIPQTFAEGRRYFTAKRLPPSVIANKKLFTAEDPDGFLFAIISSSMFMTWQKTVGGRLKSDPSFSNTVVWNNFPLPLVEEELAGLAIKAGQKILEARERHPERSLADHYNPLAMDPALLRAHDALDRVMDRAFGAPRKLTTERQRQELLFESYARMTYKK